MKTPNDGNQPPSGSQISRPLLNPAFTPVRIRDDEIELRAGPFSGPSYTLKDRDESGQLAQLPSLLDGDRSVEELTDEIGADRVSEVQSVIELLSDRGIVLDASDVDHPELAGYSAIQPSVLTDGLADVRDSSILITGPQSLCRPIVADLTDYGVSDLRVRTTDPGTTSQTCLPEATVSDTSLHDAVEATDFVVGFVQLPGDDHLVDLNESAAEFGTPWLHCSLASVEATIGPTVVPGQTACYECLTSRMAANQERPSRFDNYRSTSGGEDGPLSAFERIVSSYASIATLHYLSSGTGFTVGRQVTFDFFDLSVEASDVLKLPRCPVCSEVSTGHSRFVELEDLLHTDNYGQ